MIEPIQESSFNYNGFPCVVLFMPLGHRCGYVGIPSNNKFYKKKYNKIPINCYGGLTCSKNHLYGYDGLDKWWIGFDCGHYGDGIDEECLKKYYGNSDDLKEMWGLYLDYKRKIADGWQYIDLDYCIEQCKSIVDQIIERGNKNAAN